MATKLNNKQISALNKMGFDGLTAVEDAQALLIDFLSVQGVDNLGEDSIDELIEYAAVFEDEVEQYLNDLESTEETNGDIEDDIVETKQVVNKKQVVSKKPIVEEDKEGEYDDLAEEVEKTAKPKVSKTLDTKKLQTSTNKVVKKTSSSKDSSNKKFDARNDENDLQYLEPFIELFPDDKFSIDILKQGFTVRTVGKNAKITVLNYDELRITPDGLFGNLYANRLKSVEELQDLLPDAYDDFEVGIFRGESHPCIKKVTTEQVIDILNNGLLQLSIERSGKTDNKMGANRQKLEESLNKNVSVKQSAKPTLTKKLVARK